MRAYRRFQSFLLAYVLLTSGVEKIELLATQISLWSTSLGLLLRRFFSGSCVPLIMVRIYDPSIWALEFLSAYLVLFALAGIAYAVSRSAYQRVLDTLFALAYIIAQRATGTAPPVT